MPALSVRRALGLLAGLVVAIGQAAAADPTLAPADDGLWRTVSNRQLEQMRGGFDVGGLRVSFGITRAVYINGALVTQNTLNVGDLSRMTSAQAARLNSQIAELNLVQNGPGNHVSADLSSLGKGLIIQNTLNNQNINAQTIINASSNGLSLIRTMKLQETLDGAIQRAIGAR